MKSIVIKLLALGLFFSAVGSANATIAFKESTGLDCSSCHASPGTDMKPLTKFGTDFKANKYQLPVAAPAAPPAVTPTCPAGFVFANGRCEVVAVNPPAVTPTCPAGFAFSAGKCVAVAVTPPAVVPSCPAGTTMVCPSGAACFCAVVAAAPVPAPPKTASDGKALCPQHFYRCALNRGGRIDPAHPDCCWDLTK